MEANQDTVRAGAFRVVAAMPILVVAHRADRVTVEGAAVEEEEVAKDSR